MTQTTEEQQQMEATARSVAAKLQAFHESLTPDEQRVLDGALRSTAAGADASADDTTGYISSVELQIRLWVMAGLARQTQPVCTPTPPSQQPQRQ